MQHDRSPSWLRARRAPAAPLLAVEIAVVTPLFGGGAQPRQADPLLPVRGASVRGHLRFWWRVCRATQFATPAELFAAEADVWGSTTQPAAVQVVVDVLDAGQAHACRTDVRQPDGRPHPRWRPDYPPYALFPFQGRESQRGQTQPQEEPAVAREGVRFRLTLTAAPHVPPERRDHLLAEATATLWAWLVFGGLGARTRRGCGSLFCADPRFAPLASQVADWLRRQAAVHVTPGQRRLAVPVLAGARLVAGDQPVLVADAWKVMIQRFQEWRQDRNPGQQPNRPGRSRWPEPDSVREALRLDDPRHPPEHPARPFYPRADLGLPLIFQRLADPSPRLEAAGDGASRFASPLILKPLAVSPTQAVPLVLCLNAPHVWEGPGVELRREGARPIPLDRAQLERAGVSDLVWPLRGRDTARAAALASFAGRWQAPEVTL